MLKLVPVFLLAISTTIFAEETSSTSGKEISIAYANMGKCPDEALFLDPFCVDYLKECAGKTVLDSGCGSAARAIIAAKNGARVFGIDVRSPMLSMAKEAVVKAGVESNVDLQEGDVAALPYQAALFDRAMSINVSSNLPSTIHILHSEEGCWQIGLGKHFEELSRVLKIGGEAVVAAPASFDVVFTDGSMATEGVNKHIDEVLAKITSADDESQILSKLGELNEVLRATFVKRDGQLTLVTDERDLQMGEKVYRKIPGASAASYYHSELEYLVTLKEAGLKVKKIERPRFYSEPKWTAFISSRKEGEMRLDKNYIAHHPFTLFYVVKQA